MRGSRRVVKRRWVVAAAVGVSLAAVGAAYALSFSVSGSLTGGDSQQTGRLNRNTITSGCAANKSNPGLLTAVGSRSYDVYNVTNTANSTKCIVVQEADNCGVNGFVAAYTTFVPSNPSTNWVGDPGFSGVGQQFSFAAAANTSYQITESEVDPGGGCASYTITAFTFTVDPLSALVAGLHADSAVMHEVQHQVDAIGASADAAQFGSACAGLKSLNKFVKDHKSHFSVDGSKAFKAELAVLRGQLGC
jgi:hypothetical protein